jgi:thiol:disulfide interchange protein
MRRAVAPITVIAIIACVGYVLYPLLGHSARPVAPIKWNKDYASAVAQAKAKHTLVMIDFYTDWCSVCKDMDKHVYPNPDVIKAVSQYAPVKLNAEKAGTALAAKYDIDAYPTIVIVNVDGIVQKKIVGLEDAEDFADDISSIKSTPTATNNVVAKAQRTHPITADAHRKMI